MLCRCLCARLSPTLIAPEHLQGLLAVANQEAGDKEDGGYSAAVQDLLVGCAASAPALYANLGEQVSSRMQHNSDEKQTSLLSHVTTCFQQSTEMFAVACRAVKMPGTLILVANAYLCFLHVKPYSTAPTN